MQEIAIFFNCYQSHIHCNGELNMMRILSGGSHWAKQGALLLSAILCLVIAFLCACTNSEKASSNENMTKYEEANRETTRGETGNMDLTKEYTSDSSQIEQNTGKEQDKIMSIEHYANMEAVQSTIKKHSFTYSIWHSVDAKETIAEFYKKQFGDSVVLEELDIGLFFLSQEDRFPLVEVLDIKNNPQFLSEIHIRMETD
jgi:hypothetical protein